MDRLLDLVSKETMIRLDKVFNDQANVIGDAVNEALKEALQTERMRETIAEIVEERMQESVREYLAWLLEDEGFQCEALKPLRELVDRGIRYYMESDRAKKIAGDSIKEWIVGTFEENCLEDIYDNAEEDLSKLAKYFIRQEILKIKEHGDPELSKAAKDAVSGEVREEIVNTDIDPDDEEWEEEDKEW